MRRALVDHSASVGRRFSDWTVLGVRRGGRVRYRARCTCGHEQLVDAHSILRGASKRCGACSNPRRGRITHGATVAGRVTPEWNSWRGMLERCTNPKHKAWRHYGGRGIRVCDRWRASFEAFLKDVGPRPSQRHSIDRYPNSNGHYEPTNVRWATPSQQRMNQARMVRRPGFARTGGRP